MKCDRCARLEAENARLRERLEQKVRADIMGRLHEALGVTVHQAKFLLALYRTPGQVVPHATLCAVLPARYTKSADGKRSEHYLRVLAYQTRRSAGPDVVGTILGRGYYLTPHGLDVIRDALSGHFLRVA